MWCLFHVHDYMGFWLMVYRTKGEAHEILSTREQTSEKSMPPATVFVVFETSLSHISPSLFVLWQRQKLWQERILCLLEFACCYYDLQLQHSGVVTTVVLLQLLCNMGHLSFVNCVCCTKRDRDAEDPAHHETFFLHGRQFFNLVTNSPSLETKMVSFFSTVKVKRRFLMKVA